MQKGLHIGRRTTLVGLGSASLVPLAPAKATPPPAPAPLLGDDARLDPALPPLVTAAVYDTMMDEGVLTDGAFQKQLFLFKQREYPYYYAANKGRLPAIPDLSDLSGGLSNRSYFNFVLYATWKVVARNVLDAPGRSRVVQTVGSKLVDAVAGEERRRVSDARRGAPPVPAGVMKPALEGLLQKLQALGYIQRWAIVYGDHPGYVPQRWAEGAQVDDQEEEERSDVLPDKFQVRLFQPADIEGSVSLRQEEDSFWSHTASSMMRALMLAGGYSAEADEFFLQDEWQGPATLQDKVLLFFGDPLQRVEVPWQPSSLIQDWTVRAA